MKLQDEFKQLLDVGASEDEDDEDGLLFENVAPGDQFGQEETKNGRITDL